MAESTQEIVSTLNNLLETCKDGEQGFRDASDGVTRAGLKAIFDEYARQRAQFSSELQMHVVKLGGDPEKSGSMSGAIHRGWLNMKSAVTGKDDHSILAEVERGEDSAVKNYRQALEKDTPSDIRTVIENQYQQVLITHNRVKVLRDSGPSGPSVPVGNAYSESTASTTRMDEFSTRTH